MVWTRNEFLSPRSLKTLPHGCSVCTSGMECLSLNIFILSLTWMVYFLSLLVHKPDDWILWRKEEVALYIHVAKGLIKRLGKRNHGDVIRFPPTEVWMQTWYLTLLSAPVVPSSSELLLNRVILTFFCVRCSDTLQKWSSFTKIQIESIPLRQSTVSTMGLPLFTLVIAWWSCRSW